MMFNKGVCLFSSHNKDKKLLLMYFRLDHEALAIARP